MTQVIVPPSMSACVPKPDVMDADNVTGVPAAPG
jgi:hypothetical protein